MFDKPQASHVLGLEIDACSFKGVSLILARQQPQVEDFFDIPLDNWPISSENVKPLYNEEQKQRLEKLSGRDLIVTSLNTQDVLVRPLEMKLYKEKDIDDVLAFQTEPLLPYPVENSVIDRVILSKSKEGSFLTVFAVRKDHLTQHISQWNSLDIEPEVISAVPLALSLFSKQFVTYEELYYTLHIGITQSTVILNDQGKLVAAQAIPMGISPLIDLYATQEEITFHEAYEKFQDPNFQLTLIQDPLLKSTIETLRIALTRTIYSLTKQAKGKEVGALLITGPGATIDLLPELLSNALNKIILPVNVLPSFGMEEKELLQFALPIGQALSALPLPKKFDSDQINFRQQEFAYPNPWKRLKQPLSTYILLCFGIAVSLFIFGQSYVSYQEAVLRQNYLNLLEVMNKPYKEFEKEYSIKNPSEREIGPDEIIAVASLTPQEIRSRLNFLEKEIQATPKTYPLQPNVPLVSDVLAWISTYPSFIGQQDSEEGQPSHMQIESFNYSFVKRPEPTKKQEKYQVKVELEFSSPTPKLAREFHDALIAPNEIVDPKGEIKWNSNKDRYRTSFYLKDKTLYPNL